MQYTLDFRVQIEPLTFKIETFFSEKKLRKGDRTNLFWRQNQFIYYAMENSINKV